MRQGGRASEVREVRVCVCARLLAVPFRDAYFAPRARAARTTARGGGVGTLLHAPMLCKASLLCIALYCKVSLLLSALYI